MSSSNVMHGEGIVAALARASISKEGGGAGGKEGRLVCHTCNGEMMLLIPRPYQAVAAASSTSTSSTLLPLLLAMMVVIGDTP